MKERMTSYRKSAMGAVIILLLAMIMQTQMALADGIHGTPGSLNLAPASRAAIPLAQATTPLERMLNSDDKRVLRIMREGSLLCQLKRRFIPTTDSNHSFRTYPNLLKDMVLCAPVRYTLAQKHYPCARNL